MKNIIIIITLLLQSLAMEAQVSYYDTKSDMAYWEKRSNLDRKRIQDRHIGAEKVYRYKSVSEEKAGKGKLYSELMYDTQGNIIDWKLYRKHGGVKYHDIYKYDDKGRCTEFTLLRSNGKMKYKSITTFDSAGNWIDERAFWKRPDNMTWHSIATYDDKQNMQELKYFWKNDKKLHSKYSYTYYPDGSKKQTVEYNGKGKVKHTWNYDCNPTGTLVAKNLKDTSKICIRYETDKDGNQIKIKEENVKHGAIVRIVNKYDKNDNLIDETEYDVKGITRQRNSCVYDKENRITERTEYKGKANKVKERNVFQYDNAGNLSELIGYKTAPQPDHIYKYDYTVAQ